jgi:hypothetical protein
LRNSARLTLKPLVVLGKLGVDGVASGAAAEAGAQVPLWAVVHLLPTQRAVLSQAVAGMLAQLQGDRGEGVAALVAVPLAGTMVVAEEGEEVSLEPSKLPGSRSLQQAI